MKLILKITGIAVLLLSAPMFVPELLAQVPPPGPPVAVPIDLGAGILLLAGAAIGAKKIYDYKKKKQ